MIGWEITTIWLKMIINCFKCIKYIYNYKYGYDNNIACYGYDNVDKAAIEFQACDGLAINMMGRLAMKQI
jgi:hypothetical protein